MSLVLGPGSLFRVSTLGCLGEPDVGDGVHVALTLSPALGFPIRPFGLRTARLADFGDIDAEFFDGDGNRLTLPFDVDEQTIEVILLPPAPGDAWVWVRIDTPDAELVVQDVGGPGTGHVLARRSSPPYTFGSSGINRLRISGRGTVERIVGVSGTLAARILGQGEDHEPFGLPIDGDVAWYAGGLGRDAAYERVRRGAPSRLGPPDEPFGPGTALGTEDEVARIDALTHLVDPWIEAAFTGVDPPDRSRLSFSAVSGAPGVPGADIAQRDTSSSMDCIPALMLQGADPGIARYLGLMTTARVEPPRDEFPLLVFVWAPFAINPARLLDGVPLAEILQRARVLDGWPVEPDRLRFRTTLGIGVPAGVGATPDVPDAPSLGATAGRWRVRAPGSDPAADTWQARISILDGPVQGPVALARTDPGAGVSLHRSHGTRAVAMFAGAEAGVGGVASGPLDAVAVGDPGVPAGQGDTGAGWQVALADRFGRWGASADVRAMQPARPVPRPPVPEAHALYDDLPAGDLSVRSAGVLAVRIPVPSPDGDAPGALPVQRAELTWGGEVSEHAVLAGTEFAVELALPALAPAMTTTESVQAVFVDAGNNSSPPATRTLTVLDPRPFPVTPTGPALLWTTRRTVLGTAELALAWPAIAPDARYRVYLGSSEQLAAELGIGPVDSPPGADRPLRARLAGTIWERRGELWDKSAFTLITSTPLGPVNGSVSVRHGLSGSARGVVFVRVVPVTPAGVEAAFANCGLVPVAVPHAEVPPAPVLRARVDDAGAAGQTVSVTVEVRGVPAAIIDGTHPGAALEAQLRRSKTMHGDQAYIPVIATASMIADPMIPGRWTATFSDVPPGGLVAYQRITYAAQVRYPPELCLPPGVVPVPVDGGIVAPPGPPTGDAGSGWGAMSPLASTLWVPRAVPHPEVAPTFTSDGAVDTLTGTLPVVAGFTVEVWAESADGSLALAAGPGAAVREWSLGIATPAVPVQRYLLLLTDPLGRVGDPVPVGREA
jgi:hypothetical protein